MKDDYELTEARKAFIESCKEGEERRDLAERYFRELMDYRWNALRDALD